MPATPSSAPKTSETTLSSLALVDTVSLLDDRVRITLGLRNQNVKTTNYNATTGAVTAKYDKSAVTPAVGVILKPWGQGISLYANYVEGLSKGDTVSDTLATTRISCLPPTRPSRRKWASNGMPEVRPYRQPV